MSSKSKHALQWIPVAAVALCLATLPLFSQGTAGRIIGAITDQTGGAMSGATITITSL